jgi:hypothetical protein
VLDEDEAAGAACRDGPVTPPVAGRDVLPIEATAGVSVAGGTCWLAHACERHRCEQQQLQQTPARECASSASRPLPIHQVVLMLTHQGLRTLRVSM